MSYIINYRGYDITEYCLPISGLENRKGSYGDLVYYPNLTVVVDNTKEIFTQNHPNAIISSNWLGDQVEIFKDGELLFDGRLRNINLTKVGNQAELQLTSAIDEVLNANLITYESGLKTLAELSEDLYLAYGIEIDYVSYETARIWQNIFGIKAKLAYVPPSSMTLIQAQQWLADTGLCRHYFIGNKAYMQFINQSETKPVTYVFTDNDIIDIQLTKMEKEYYDSYVVNTLQGQALGAGSKAMPAIDGGSGSAFIFPYLITGVNIGTLLLNYVQSDISKVTVSLIRNDASNYITLNTYISLQGNKLGQTYDLEILSIDKSDDSSVTLECETI